MATNGISVPTPARPGGRLLDKIAIVTGGASGIGRAISLRYANEGAHVVVADMRDESRNPAESATKTHELIQKLGRRSIFVQTDVTNSDSVDNLVKAAVDEFGRLDIMCNNAGAAFETSLQAEERMIWSMPNETWKKTMSLNCDGVFYGTRAAAKQMMTQEPHDGSGDRGWIVNTASVMGMVGVQGASAYCSSKHLVLGLTKTAALDLAPYRVHVNAICPGYVKSAFTASLWEDEDVTKAVNAQHPFRGVGEPEDIARIAVFLASDDARWVHGAGIVADGGYTCQ